MLRIGIDLDGPCYEFGGGALCSYIHESTGRPLETMPYPQTWHFYANEWGMSLQEFLDLFAAGVNAGYIFSHGDPMPGAKEALDQLKAAGHRLIAITDRGKVGRPGLAKRLTLDWITRHQLPFDELHVSGNKALVSTDMFIDDRLENYDALEAIEETVPVLFDRPWNQDDGTRIRAHSWAQFVAMVELVEVLRVTNSARAA